jgi:hypothetical protein
MARKHSLTLCYRNLQYKPRFVVFVQLKFVFIVMELQCSILDLLRLWQTIGFFHKFFIITLFTQSFFIVKRVCKYNRMSNGTETWFYILPLQHP